MRLPTLIATCCGAVPFCRVTNSDHGVGPPTDSMNSRPMPPWFMKASRRYADGFHFELGGYAESLYSFPFGGATPRIFAISVVAFAVSAAPHPTCVTFSAASGGSGSPGDDVSGAFPGAPDAPRLTSMFVPSVGKLT